MDTLSWISNATAAWFGAAAAGAGLILLLDARARRAEPTGEAVREAAERYRQHYGDGAVAAIGDHMLAATFSPVASQHRRFLLRVSTLLVRNV